MITIDILFNTNSINLKLFSFERGVKISTGSRTASPFNAICQKISQTGDIPIETFR